MNKITSPIIFGDSSQPVADLQNALIKLGFGPIDATETGQQVFSNSTCSALKMFKEKFKIQSFPCLVESRTAAAINTRLAALPNSTAVTAPLLFGMKSQAVTDLQSALARIGFGANIDAAEKGVFGKTTCTAILTFQKGMKIEVTPCYVDSETADKINALIDTPGDNPPKNDGQKYTVSGYIFDAGNKPVDRQPVNAYDIDLFGAGVYKKATTITQLTAQGGVQLLGKTAITDANGFYSIDFTNNDFQTDESAEDPTADVLIVAVDGENILGRSALARKKDYVNNELRNTNVHFSQGTTRRGTSEFATISPIITRFLNAQIKKISAWQLFGNIDMIEFLATEIAVDVAKVTAYTNAANLINAITTDAAGLPTFALDQQKAFELLYGLVKPTSATDWLAVSKISVIDAQKFISKSSNTNIISEFSDADIATFAKALHNYAVSKAQVVNTPLKNVLNIALKSDVLAQKFHTLYANNAGTPKEFWDKIAADTDLKSNLEALKLTNQLAALTGNNSPVMSSLALLVKNNDITDLLQLTITDWNQAIGNNIPPFITGGVDEYRNYMISQLHAAFYSEKIGLMVKNADEIKIADASIRNKLSAFLSSTKFDFRYSRLHDKVDSTEDTFQQKLNDIGGEQLEELTKQLNRVQRIFQFSPSPEIMSRILASDIDSATQIASMPYSAFKVKYKDLADEATLLAMHQRASHIVSMIEYSLLSLNRFSQSGNIPAIAGRTNN